MDISNINGVMLAFCGGFIVACVLFAILAFRVEAKRSKVVSDFLSSHDTLEASWDKEYRELLQKLEAGDIEDAKLKVCLAIATFYHISGSRGASQGLAAERQKIDIQAKSSAMLAAAIEKTSEWRKPSPNNSLQPTATAPSVSTNK
jgi:hypothetical protein